MFGGYDDGNINEDLIGFSEKGFCDKWMLGFKFEITSAFYFFQKELYKSAIIETILFFAILIPYIIVQVGATVAFALIGLWRYSWIIAALMEIIAIFLLFVLICVSPLVTDMYNRVSEKTEKMLNFEEVNPSSTPRCTPGCCTFILVYSITGIIEFFFFFLPIFLVCFACLIIPPLGIFLLMCYNSFVRSWGSFKVVFLRHGLDYFGFLKFFFLTPEVIPFYMGVGTGYMCMKRVMRQFPGGGLLAHIVTIVSATRFYHFYILNKGEIASGQMGGDNASFMSNQQQQQNPAVIPQQQGNMMGGQQDFNNPMLMSQPVVTADNVKNDF